MSRNVLVFLSTNRFDTANHDLATLQVRSVRAHRMVWAVATWLRAFKRLTRLLAAWQESKSKTYGSVSQPSC